MDFDSTRLYYSHQQLQPVSPNDDDGNHQSQTNNNNDSEDTADIDLPSCQRHFREFLRTFWESSLPSDGLCFLMDCACLVVLVVFGLRAGNYRLGPRYIYRDRLLRLHRRRGRHGNTTSSSSSSMVVDLSHLGDYDSALLGLVLHQPAAVLPTLEQAAHQALQSLLYQQQQQPLQEEEPHNEPRPDQDSSAEDGSIQLLWMGHLRSTPLRQIQSHHMGRLVSCPGIVVSTSPVRNRAVRLLVRCSRCHDEQVVSATADGGGGDLYGSMALPAACRSVTTAAGATLDGNTNNNNTTNDCGRYPYAVVPDESDFCDQQTLKLQEAPETVPTGELPRSVLVTVDRALVDVAPPGTRVTVVAIPTLAGGGNNNNNKGSAAAKSVYLRVVGLVQAEDPTSTSSSRSSSATSLAASFPPAQEEAFRALSQRADIYDILTRSMAPNISGSYTVDIKKALVCQLMGGVSKHLPDGVRLRGDINVLLLGDPSMAKSQFLKFVSKVAPVGIYTSGKGSSAAGLTASVVRDSKGEFYLEGGALVLADGGVVCVDEFDKMRPNDRVAIHEAMEQQTISVAKAGITTVLHSRASVLAAANPVFGRYDDLKAAHENIDLMTTILSRFDVIFLVRDVRDEERDKAICQHVMGVHMDAASDTAMGRGGGGRSALGNGTAATGNAGPPNVFAHNLTAPNDPTGRYVR